ncbi:hypothetical protein MMPV_001066 [Pyropia vietnamensis]
MAAAAAPSAAALLADLGAPAHLVRERCLLRLRAALPSPGVRAACRASLIAAWTADAATRTATATPAAAATSEGETGGRAVGGGGGEPPAAREGIADGTFAGGWERACGLLRAAAEVLASAGGDAGGRGGGGHVDEELFEAAVLDAAVEGIRHEEVRVRQAAGDALGALAGHRGAQVWAAAAPVVLANVEKNAALDESQRAREASRLAQQTLARGAAAVPPAGGGAPLPPGEGDQGKTAGDVPTDAGGTATATDGTRSGGAADATAAVCASIPSPGGDASVAARDRGRRMVHETEGWRGLETSLSALAKLLSGAGAPVLAAVAADGGGPTTDPHIAAAVAFTVAGHTHANRFVRETCLGVLTALVTAAATADGTAAPSDTATAAPSAGGGSVPTDAPASAPLVDALVPTVARVVAAGLADNWSQVRYAASVCVRVLLASATAAALAPYVGDLLLPRLLLNRHYVADGVRVYSLGTYATSPVTAGGRGRATLIAHLPVAVEYFVAQAEADNHAVREASCRSLAEVAAVLPANAVTPLLERMIPALVTATDDGSWPVRDVAMDAIAAVAAAYPAAVADTGVLDGPDGVVAVWHAALQDVIPSVRHGAAACIARAAAAYGAHVAAAAAAAATPVSAAVAAVAALLTPEAVAAAISERLATPLDVSTTATPTASGAATADTDQPSVAITGFGPVAKAARDNDAALHTGQTVYSCGSLAPKLPSRRSARGARPPVAGGCSGGGHGPPPAAAAWHVIDGGLRLWVAVVTTGPGPLRDAVVPLLAEVADAARRAAGAPFAQAAPLLGCVWAAVVDGVPAVGDAGDGRIVDPTAFADALRVSVSCGQRGVEVAAKRARAVLAAAAVGGKRNKGGRGAGLQCQMM